MQLQVGVKVLLMDQDGSILILRRATPISDGTIVWDIPGGRINPGEKIKDALAREVREETGIAISDKLTLIDAQDIYPSDSIHVVRLTYVCRVDRQDITLSQEHDLYNWANEDGMSELVIDPFVENSMRLIDERA